MAIKKATYRFDNGISFDEIMFKTTADQVVFEDGKDLQTKLNNGELGGGGGTIDLSEYAKKTEVSATYATKDAVNLALDDLEGLIESKPAMAAGSSPLTLWYGTQSEYDAIATKDANTLYIVK